MFYYFNGKLAVSLLLANKFDPTLFILWSNIENFVNLYLCQYKISIVYFGIHVKYIFYT